MKKTLKVPICISGGITAAHPSLCMDCATHLIDTPVFGSVRLVASNAAAKKALNKFQDAKVVVTVCGYPRRSVNCVHLEVYAVGLAKKTLSHLTALADKVGNG